MLKKVRDIRVRGAIVQRIEELRDDPEKRGKPLLGELSGYYAIRAPGQRYRVIFTIEKSKVTILIVAVGLRRSKDRSDIYSLARKLLRSRLLDK